MRAAFRFEHGTKLTDVQLEALARAGVHVTPDDDGNLKSWESHTADLRKVMAIAPTAHLVLMAETSAQPLLEVMDALERIETRQRTTEPEAYVNNKVDVHVPGFGLLAVQEVTVMEDSCTEDLQARLEEGWRILAICPQPDQRRPDYVIGRSREAVR